MAVEAKSRDEIKLMRTAGQVVGQTLALLAERVRPGLNIRELDEFVREEYQRRKVVPTFLGYPHRNDGWDYPATVCISINDQIVHGIPVDRVLVEGDIVSIDLGATYQGFVGDAAITVPCGKVSDAAAALIETTRGALWTGIEAAHAGARLGDVGAAIQQYTESRGYSLVREFVGHGVGRRMHEEPEVPNWGEAGKGRRLQPGWVIAIEPMVNIGGAKTRAAPDHWTIYTADGSLSAHFEHTLAITTGAAEVLTLP